MIVIAVCCQGFVVIPLLSTEAAAMQARPRPAPPPRPQRRPPPRPDINYELHRLDTTAARVEAMRLALQRQQAARALAIKARRETVSTARQAQLRAKLEKQHGLSLVQRRGYLTLIRHREILGVNMTDAERASLISQGFKILRRQALMKIGVVMDLYLAPDGVTNDEALEMVQSLKGKGIYRHNAVYQLMGDVAEEIGEGDKVAPIATPHQGVSVGLLDTGVHAEHKQLQGLAVTQQNFGRGADVLPRDHGTAVVSLLQGGGAQQFFVADVFSGPILYADVEAIALGLNWLAEQGVGVINISLAGPPDDVLAHATATLVQDGYILVAAVGNEGPESPLMYPAAYTGVVGVTAVDKDMQLYEKASRGLSVDFASQGVKVRAAGLKGTKKYTGTSFATPVVSSFLSHHHQRPDRASALQALHLIHGAALDQGAPGYDPLYGYGVFQFQ